MKTSIAVASLAACILALSITACGQPPPESPAEASEQTFQQIMQSEIDIQADQFWNASGIVEEAGGERSLTPKTDAEWLEVRKALQTLTAGADKLTTPGRPLVEPGGKIEDEGLESIATPDWIRNALVEQRPLLLTRVAALKSVANEGSAAVDRRDLKAIDEIGERLDAQCEVCHETFWYPPSARTPGYKPPTLPAKPPAFP
jgi:cytochrome c556